MASKKKVSQPTLFDLDVKKSGSKVAQAVQVSIHPEIALKKYLDSFTHKRCGGKPIAYYNGAVVCSKCKYSITPLEKCTHFKTSECLGHTLARSNFIRQ